MYLFRNCVILAFNKLFGAEFDRFRLGQLFFISAVTFGLLFSDTTRKILIISSLFCLTKTQIKENFYISWSTQQKTTGCILLFLCLWIFFIPLFFGVDPILIRLQSTGWGIELFVFMWATLLFAKDFFFIENIKKFAIITCISYSVFALCQRFSLGFVIDFSNWPMSLGAWSVGTILSVLLPWMLYDVIVETSSKKTIFLLFALTVTSIVLFLTLYTTFWLVLLIYMAIVLCIMGLFFKDYFQKLFFLMILLSIIVIVALYCASHFYKNLYDGLFIQFSQLSLSEFNAEKFTNSRYHIWVEAVNFINLRPILGYGWAEFADFSVEQRGHTHCAFLQAAWTAGWPAMVLLISFLMNLTYRCLSLMKKQGKLLIVPFVVLLVILAYFACGALDDMFRATRRIVTLYWVTFMLMLTPLVDYNEADSDANL